MDKNEILKKHIQNYYHYKGKSVKDDDILPVSRVKPLMDEWAEIKAKEQSIAFIRWAVENHSAPYEGFSLLNLTDGSAIIFVDHEEITVSQLYDLFIFYQQSQK